MGMKKVIINKQGAKNVFFDAHMHAYNLSHPNIGAFLGRLINIKLLIGVMAGIIFANIGILIIILFINPYVELKHVLIIALCLVDLLVLALVLVINRTKLMNFIRIMDYSIGPYFLQIEEDIMQYTKSQKIKGEKKNYLEFDNMKFDRYALIPLMMHFTNDKRRKEENRKKGRYALARKSIQEQTVDLFQGIRYYYENSDTKLLKFYPFMGITLNNDTYDMEHLRKVLCKYFCCFPFEHRSTLLYDEHVKFDGDIDKLKCPTFTGIKVYPPLGFDPWPDRNDFSSESELEKAKFLYEFCEKRSIPIVTHCGGKGYNSIDNKRYKRFGSPGGKWQEVLKKYKHLRICFAHFGPEITVGEKDSWTDMIMELILNDDYPNVYTDISCRCYNEKDFKLLMEAVRHKADQRGVLESRIYDYILYGTDFPMNIKKGGTYGTYLNAFLEVDMPPELKNKLCNVNPRKFLFNES